MTSGFINVARNTSNVTRAGGDKAQLVRLLFPLDSGQADLCQDHRMFGKKYVSTE